MNEKKELSIFSNAYNMFEQFTKVDIEEVKQEETKQEEAKNEVQVKAIGGEKV